MPNHVRQYWEWVALTAIEDFEVALSREASAAFETLLPDQWDSLEHRVGLLLNGQNESSPREYGRTRLDFVRRLFLDFTEIAESWDRMHHISRYVGRFPYGDTDISRTAHLCYHVENYLNEAYILRNRMDAYLKAINRLYKQDSRSSRVRTIAATLNDLLPKTFATTVEARGKHVHRQRYTNSDLDRLRALELLKDDSERWASEYQAVYRETRRRERYVIDRTNRYIERRLQSYFLLLGQLLFDRHGHLIFPEALQESA